MHKQSQHVFLKFILLTLVCYSIQEARAEKKKREAIGAVKQCAELIRDCFARSDSDLSNCFYSAAKHPFCEGSDLGKLAYKRWSMSPSQGGNENAPPAFLGPQLVDRECLSNFDNQWSSELIRGGISKDTLKKLEAKIDSCKKDTSIDLLRP